MKSEIRVYEASNTISITLPDGTSIHVLEHTIDGKVNYNIHYFNETDNPDRFLILQGRKIELFEACPG